MSPRSRRQQDKAVSLLKRRGMVRLSELAKAGVTAATVSRMRGKGAGPSPQPRPLPAAGCGAPRKSFACGSRQAGPKGHRCLTSALAFHELTDTVPARVWMAIGSKDRLPRIDQLPLQFVRFGPKVLATGIQQHVIEGVRVRVYSPAKTVVDLFRYRRSAGRRYQRSPGLNLALEGLRESLRQRKAAPPSLLATPTRRVSGGSFSPTSRR